MSRREDAQTISDLRKKLSSTEADLKTAKEQIADATKLEDAALRRVFALPQGIKELLQVENLEVGVPTPDGRGVTWAIGGNLNITVFPFNEGWGLSDVQGRMRPLSFTFGKETDVTPTQVLAVLGYKDLANRTEPFGDAGFLSDQLNSWLLPAQPS